MKYKFAYQCNDCEALIETKEVTYLCPNCEKKNVENQPPKGVLKTIYNYEQIAKKNSYKQLKRKLNKGDYSFLMPVNKAASYPKLKAGNTPLYDISENEDYPLFAKDDSQNPTYSFKDRASYLVSAFAKENGIDTIIAASTGNAGSSLAGICASNKQKAVIFVPEAAPKAKLTQIIMYGAKIIPVKGTYDDAFDLSVKATKEFGYYNRNTAYNPFTIEGKKTVAYEIFTKFGKALPDTIFVSAGDGVIISAVYKGFEDLLKLNLINNVPEIIAVQAEGSCNIVANLDTEKFVAKPSSTIADSIAVDVPRNFFMAKKFIKTYNGSAIMVSDDEIIKASKKMSKGNGLFSEPAAAAAYAGYLKLKKLEKIKKGQKCLVLLTGSGLKDLDALLKSIKIPKAITPELSAVQKLL